MEYASVTTVPIHFVQHGVMPVYRLVASMSQSWPSRCNCRTREHLDVGLRFHHSRRFRCPFPSTDEACSRRLPPQGGQYLPLHGWSICRMLIDGWQWPTIKRRISGFVPFFSIELAIVLLVSIPEHDPRMTSKVVLLIFRGLICFVCLQSLHTLSQCICVVQTWTRAHTAGGPWTRSGTGRSRPYTNKYTGLGTNFNMHQRNASTRKRLETSLGEPLGNLKIYTLGVSQRHS